MLELLILFAVLYRRFGPGFTGLTYDRMDQYILDRESHKTRIWVFQLSFLLILAACFYVRVDTGCAYLGRHYAQLAANPFSFDLANPVAYRILTPLISYLLFLRQGCLISVTNLILAGVMIGCVYSYFRKTSPRPGDAFLSALVITFSLVILTTVHCGGYTDVTTYLIVFLMWRYRSKRWVFHGLFLLGLFNRESIGFLVPWFVFISLQSENNKPLRLLELCLGFGLSLLVYYLFRQWISSQQEVQYSTAYYLQSLLENPLSRFGQNPGYHSLGLFSVFKVLWVVPVLACLSMWKRQYWSEIGGIALLLVCSWSQLFVAGDTSRMFTLGFMVIIVSLRHFFRTDDFHFRSWAIPLVLLNLLIPQVYTAGSVVEVWQSLSTYLLFLVWG